MNKYRNILKTLNRNFYPNLILNDLKRVDMHVKQNYITHMTSVTNSTGFIARKYSKNFERKYNYHNVWIID